jgi:hypothetical protein
VHGEPALLNQFNSVESLLENAGPMQTLRGGVQQATITGNGNAIFNAISRGGQVMPNGTMQMPNGTILYQHMSSSTGVFTIAINTRSEIFKIRVNP